MGLKDRLLKKKQDMQDQMQRGREVTEQMRAEKLRRKMDKYKGMKPGARKAIHDGMVMRKSPLDVMRDEYGRRKYERKQRYAKDKDE